MGISQSTPSGGTGDILLKLNAVIGLVGQASPLDTLLRSVLGYRPELRVKGRSSLDGIYTIAEPKDIAKSGLLIPSFQKDRKQRWVVREVKPEMIMSRFKKSDDSNRENIELSYMLIESILAITQLSLLSLKIQPNIVENVMRKNNVIIGTKSAGFSGDLIGETDSEGITDSTEQEFSVDYTRIFNLVKKYGLAREYRKDKNPINYNALFEVSDVFSDILGVITEANKSRRKTESNIYDSGETETSSTTSKTETPFHMALMVVLNSFSICRSNRRTITLLRLLERQKDGGIGIITKRMIQILNTKAMNDWLTKNPSESSRIAAIIRGLSNLSGNISATGPTPGSIFNQVLSKNIQNVIEHMKQVCAENPQFSYDMRLPVVETIQSKESSNILLQEKYSPEVKIGIRRIFDRFKNEEERMIADVLRAFSRLFIFTKTPIPDTLSIEFKYTKDGKEQIEYLCLMPSITKSNDPMRGIVNCFLQIISAYTSYIMRVLQIIRNTFTRTARIL
jgi:hypothetical protein